mgnify:CR=1 FL=1|jgi:two-component system, LytTR family, response regulator
MSIRSIIIDDEPLAREGLQLLLFDYCPEVIVCATAKSAHEGIQMIEKFQPELVFLDIEMPGGNGFEVIDYFNDKTFDVIFTTAYSEFAIKALRNNAVDYLLKPIDPDELVAAVSSATQKKSNQKSQFVKIKKKGVGHFIPQSDIIMIKANGRSSALHLKGGKIETIGKNIKDWEMELPKDLFFRIHKSYIINLKHIIKISSGQTMMVNLSEGHTAEVSRRKRNELSDLLL